MASACCFTNSKFVMIRLWVINLRLYVASCVFFILVIEGRTQDGLGVKKDLVISIRVTSTTVSTCAFPHLYFSPSLFLRSNHHLLLVGIDDVNSVQGSCHQLVGLDYNSQL